MLTMLVPLDGSTFAAQALPVAADLARRTGGTLQFVTVHTPVAAVAAFDAPSWIDPTLDQEVRQRELVTLAEMGRRPEFSGVQLAAPAVLDGAVAPALADFVARAKVDMVVMTTHGRGPLSRFWLGSVADRLLRTLNVPMLLVRPRHEGAPPALPEHGPVVVALDNTARSDEILFPVRALGLASGAVITLVHVLQPIAPLLLPDTVLAVPDAGPLLETLQLAAYRHLHALAHELREAGYTVHVEVRTDPDVSGTILRVAHEVRAALVAITTHGYGGATRLLLGSVADKIIRGAECPVLVWRRAEA